MLLRIALNLLADRRHPPLSKLAKIEKPKKFLWSILPSIARSFSFCIAFLPNRLAPSLAVAYAYCRMLDTYEDVAANPSERTRLLGEFIDRFPDSDQMPEPAPSLGSGLCGDPSEESHILLVSRSALVDSIYCELPPDHRAAIRRLVRRMGTGMIWATETFIRQGGSLRSSEQLSRYCSSVLGNPVLFAEEMQRLDMGLPPQLAEDRRKMCAFVGEVVQLANITRDLEKDCRRGVYYHSALADCSSEQERAEVIGPVRRELITRAFGLGRVFRPFVAGIPSRNQSLARGSALLMILFTVAFYQGAARRAGLPVAEWETLSRRRAAWVWLWGTLSRNATSRYLSRLESDLATAFEHCLPLVRSPATNLQGDWVLTPASWVGSRIQNVKSQTTSKPKIQD